MVDRVPPSVVMVVDDEPRNRRLVAAVLREHEVVEAADGAEALALPAGRRVRLVLLDIMMPGLDGFTVCHEIKQRFATADRYVPVLLLTALDDQADRNRGLEAGADDFIAKPFDGRELALRVRAFLRI